MYAQIKLIFDILPDHNYSEVLENMKLKINKISDKYSAKFNGMFINNYETTMFYTVKSTQTAWFLASLSYPIEIIIKEKKNNIQYLTCCNYVNTIEYEPEFKLYEINIETDILLEY